MGQLDLHELFGETFEEDFASITLSNPAVTCSFFINIDPDCTSYDCTVYRMNATYSGTENYYSYTYETVMYVYVTSDVTVSGKGKTETTEQWNEWDGITWTITSTERDFSLELTTGWNSLHHSSVGTVRINLSNGTATETYTETLSLGSPPLRWRLVECDEHYTGSSMSMMNRSAANGGQSAVRELKTPHQMKGSRLHF